MLWLMGTIACDGWQEIKPKNVCSAIKFVTSSVYWVLYWWLLLYFETSSNIYNETDRDLMIETPNILLKQVCGWYDFAILLENVTSRACLFRSELSDNVHSDLFFKLEFNAQA